MWIPYVRNLAELTENERNLYENISKRSGHKTRAWRKQLYGLIGKDSDLTELRTGNKPASNYGNLVQIIAALSWFGVAASHSAT